MAKVEFDPNTVTLGDIGNIYQTAQDIKSKPTFNQKLFGEYMDVPVLELFDDSKGDPIARTIIRTAAESETIPENSLKGLMQNLRNVNVFLRRQMGKDAPDYLLKTDDAKQGALELFGFDEPAKAKAKLGISMTPERREKFFTELLKYGAENPKEMPAVRAVIFGMNTGLRPGAYVVTGKGSGMRPDYYLDDAGALFIPPEATGAKGTLITVPLNAMADSMVQQQLALGTKAEYIFSFEDGTPVKSADINKILAKVKVPKMIYEASTRKYYDTFMLSPEAKTKKGVQILRNYHTTWGTSNGVDPVVLAKLQGRSGKSSVRGSTGEMFTYESIYPGEVSPYEREEANRFAATFQPELERVKTVIRENVNPDFQFDTGNVDTDAVTTRITSSTAGFEEYFNRPVADEVEQPTVSITEGPKEVSETTKKSLIDKFIAFGGGKAAKTVTGLGIAGVGYGLAEKIQAAEERVEAGEGTMPAYLKEGAKFIAEDVSPVGIVEPVVDIAGSAVEAGLEAGAEAAQQEAEEKGISGDLESQLRSIFGVPPQF